MSSFYLTFIILFLNGVLGALREDKVTPDYPINWKTEIERVQNKWKKDQKKWFDYVFDPHYDVENYDLYEGTEIPSFGINTKTEENLFDALVFALRLGYRYFHTSISFNNYQHIAKAIGTVGIRPSSVYLSLSIQPQYYGYKSTINAVKTFIDNMEIKGVNLCIMDGPEVIFDPDDTLFDQAKLRRLTWMALESLHEDGICENLGVAHFEKKHLIELLDVAKYKPNVNLIEFHPYNLRKKLKKYMVRERMIVISEDVLNPTGDNRLLREPLIRDLAQKYAKTPSQIILKWAMQQAIVALPSDNHKQQIADNAQILGFTLDYNDISKINDLDEGKSYGKSYDHVETIKWRRNKEFEAKFALYYKQEHDDHHEELHKQWREYKAKMVKDEL